MSQNHFKVGTVNLFVEEQKSVNPGQGDIQRSDAERSNDAVYERFLSDPSIFESKNQNGGACKGFICKLKLPNEGSTNFTEAMIKMKLNGFINMTQVAQIARVRIGEFLKDPRVKNILETIGRNLKLTYDQLVQKDALECLGEVQTYCHPHLAVTIAYNLGAIFYNHVITWTQEYLVFCKVKEIGRNIEEDRARCMIAIKIREIANLEHGPLILDEVKLQGNKELIEKLKKEVTDAIEEFKRKYDKNAVDPFTQRTQPQPIQGSQINGQGELFNKEIIEVDCDKLFFNSSVEKK